MFTANSIGRTKKRWGGVRSFVFASCLILFSQAQAQPPDSLWSHIYGRSTYDPPYDGFGDVVQTADSGFVIVGGTRLDITHADGWFIKTNSVGDTLWTRTYGTNLWDGGQRMFVKVRQLADSGYIIAGMFVQDSIGMLWLVRMNSVGDTLWSRVYEHREEMFPEGLEMLPDGGFLMAGFGITWVQGGGDIDTLDAWLLRTDMNGNAMWMRVYDWARAMAFHSLAPTRDGGFILCGQIRLPDSTGGGWLVKIDAAGDTLWTRGVSSGLGYDDRLFDALQTDDGGFAATGWNPGQLWMVRFDSAGTELWQRAYGGFGAVGYSIIQARDGGFLVGGKYVDDYDRFWILHTDSNGTLDWDRMPSLLGIPSADVCKKVLQTADGGILAAGEVYAYAIRIGVIKYGTPSGIGAHYPMLPDSFALVPSVFPNPFNGVATIAWYQIKSGPVTVVVHDVLGRLVETLTEEPLSPGRHILPFDGRSLSSGSYFISVQTPDDLYRRRVLLLK